MFDGHSQDHQIGCTFDENIHHWYLLGNGSLHGFVNRLDCGSLDDLLQYVTSRELHLSVTSGFSRQEEQILMFYKTTALTWLHIFHSMTQTMSFCLVNWELIVSLLRRVSPERQNKFARRSKYLTYKGEDIAAPVIPPSEPFFIIDTHFHLDLVVKCLRFRNFMNMNTLTLHESWFLLWDCQLCVPQ